MNAFAPDLIGCSKCGRSHTADTVDSPACVELATVRSLRRFDEDPNDNPAFRSGRMHALKSAHLDDDRNRAIDITIRTAALLRAYGRIVGNRTLSLVERYRNADEVAHELAHSLMRDASSTFGLNAEKFLTEAIQDECPGCGKPMTAEDGPALRDDYRCGKCIERSR